MDISSTKDLLAPFSVDEFFETRFGIKPVHIKGSAEKFEGLMNWEILTQFSRQIECWNPANFRLIKNGETFPPQVYCKQTREGDLGTAMRPDWNLVQRHLSSGATLALYFIQSLSQELRDLTQLMETTFHGRAQFNLYCSWEGGKGLLPHFDTHDVFAIHLEGKKKWYVYDKPIDKPIAHGAFLGPAREKMDKQSRKPIIECVMEPGDLLYIPRGYYHDALTLTPGCFHVTVGMHYPVGLDVANVLWSLLGNDARFREALRPAGSDGSEKELKAQIEVLAEAISSHMSNPIILEQVAKVRDQFGTEKFPADFPAGITNKKF